MSLVNKPIPLFRPDITDHELQAVEKVLRGVRLSMGPMLEALEAGAARRAARRHGVGVNSGASGLHRCLEALGIGEGDEVITASFGFVAVVQAILFHQARPVLVDIDPGSYNMDPSAVASAVTPRTKAIVPLAVYGDLACFDRYERIARQAGLALIEDSTEALGGSLGGRPAGSFGDCSVLEFFPDRHLAGGDGGMIVTGRRAVADRCRSLRNQGRDNGAYFGHERVGYNYRMTEFSAAVAMSHLRRINEMLARYRAVADLYDRALAGVPEVLPPPRAQREATSWFMYVVHLAENFTAADRDAAVRRLARRGVECQAGFPAIDGQPFFRRLRIGRAGQFPRCRQMAARTIALPFHGGMTDRQVEAVARELIAAVRPASGRRAGKR